VCSGIDLGLQAGVRARDSSRHADSQGTSTVLCGDDLKSKLGSLPPQPIFGTADGVSFRLVKDTLVAYVLDGRFSPTLGRLVGCLTFTGNTSRLLIVSRMLDRTVHRISAVHPLSIRPFRLSYHAFRMAYCSRVKLMNTPQRPVAMARSDISRLFWSVNPLGAPRALPPDWMMRSVASSAGKSSSPLPETDNSSHFGTR